MGRDIFLGSHGVSCPRERGSIYHLMTDPHAPFVGDELVQMHVARIFTQYLQEVDFPVLDWPACSAALNPVNKSELPSQEGANL